MANRHNKKPKQSPLSLYRIHDDSKVACVVCTANGVSRSFNLIGPSTLKIRDKYAQLYASGILKDIIGSDELSIDELTSSLNGHLVWLAGGTIDKKCEFTAFSLVVRTVIEKLALLNFILEAPDRQVKLSEMYKKSTFDILALADLKDDEELLRDWKDDNEWTSSDMMSRIEALGVHDAKFVYAYTSRIAHAVNRDASMKSAYDAYHIKMYMLIIVSKLYNSTYLKQLSVENKNATSLRHLHEQSLTDLDQIWDSLGIHPRDLLRLTSFVHYYDKKSKVVNEFLTKYKNDISANDKSEFFKRVEYIDKVE